MIKLENFRFIQLKNGYILNYHKNLRITVLKEDVILLGEAYSIHSSENNLADDLSDVIEMEVLIDRISYWSGRWVLLWHEYIIPDASALLNVYYAKNVAASSLRLISEFTESQINRGDVHISDYFGMNFFPSPLTPFVGIKRLMPSQIYNITNNNVIDTELLSKSDYTALSNEQRVKLIISWFDVLMNNMSRDFSKVLLTLTGGHDSRTMMALLEHAQINYSAFTMDHPRIEKQDIYIPQQLCKKCKREWCLVNREKDKFSKDKFDAFDIHTFGMIQGDREFYAYNQYPEEQRALLLRNSVWENVINWYEPMLPNLYDIKTFENQWINVAYDEPMRKSILAWIRHAKEVESKVDRYNRFFWEQRSGAWLASLEQGLDILNGTISMQACNCKEIITLLYSFSKEDRTTKKFEEMIIAEACPEIADIPYAAKTTEKLKTIQRVIHIRERVIEKPKMFIYFYRNWGFLIAVKALAKNMVKIIRRSG